MLATRSSRLVLTQCRNSLLLFSRQKQPQVPNLYNHLLDRQYKVVPAQGSLLNRFNPSRSAIQWFGISSSASPQAIDKDATQSGNGKGSAPPGLLKLMADIEKWRAKEKEELKTKHELSQKMQNSMDRIKRDAENRKMFAGIRRDLENMKKSAVQDFVERLLDIADNLARASSVVKESLAKIDKSKDAAGVVPLLRRLLEGVAMSEKQLAEVFKKLEKYDPLNEEFDPDRHNDVFRAPRDPSKPPNTVAVVLKAGYMLHDRVIRPAEVGVTPAENNE